MVVRQIPGLGLSAFWDLGEGGWNTGMDTNLRLLSAVVGARVQSRVTALPASPAVGSIYIVPAGDATNWNKLAVWDGPSGAQQWVYITPQVGWHFFVVDEGANVQWTGSSWVAFAGGGGGGAGGVTIIEQTAAFSVTDTLLSGNRVVKANFSTAADITVPSGLTGTEPLTVIATGPAAVRFVAGSGVTIGSAYAKYSTRVRYSGATLIPLGSNSYVLVGDIA